MVNAPNVIVINTQAPSSPPESKTTSEGSFAEILRNTQSPDSPQAIGLPADLANALNAGQLLEAPAELLAGGPDIVEPALDEVTDDEDDALQAAALAAYGALQMPAQQPELTLPAPATQDGAVSDLEAGTVTDALSTLPVDGQPNLPQAVPQSGSVPQPALERGLRPTATSDAPGADITEMQAPTESSVATGSAMRQVREAFNLPDTEAAYGAPPPSVQPSLNVRQSAPPSVDPQRSIEQTFGATNLVRDTLSLHRHEVSYSPRGTHVEVGLNVPQNAPAEFRAPGTTEAQRPVNGVPAQAYSPAVRSTLETRVSPEFAGPTPLELSADDSLAVETSAAYGERLAPQLGNTLAPQTSPADSAQPTEFAQTGEARQLMRSIVDALPKPLSSMNIQIRPQGYGTINIRIVMPPGSQDPAQCRIEIRTTDRAACTLLSDNIGELKQNLQLESVRVSTSAPAPAAEVLETNKRSGSREDAPHRQPVYDFQRDSNGRKSKELFELLDESRR